MSTVAHKVSDKQRTNDVLISENISFDGLLLSDKVLNGLKNTGFIKPSPIQLKAIPLGRCGLDLIVQAKSGTGKTCVFSVIALESICTDSASTQVLVLAPTREIAVQIWEVIKGIGSAIKGLECHTFIGGLPLHEDRVKIKKCHIAVGSPGRIKQLIETGALRTENIRMFILDEADKLLEEGFQDQINWIYSTLPENKQMLALSATYPEYLADHLTAYMRNPTFLRLNISDPALLGIRQYYQSVQYHPLSHVVFEEKCKVLINLLSSISFQQCLVFSNVQTRASNLADTLTNKGWPTACIAGCLDQKDRNHAMAKLKTYKCRILISTDLTARGIDADKVNLVINMDIPKDHETYLHRIGRAGRFGSFGIAVSLVSDGQETMNMNSIEKRSNTTIHPLPDPLPVDLAKAGEPVYLDDMVTSEVINTDSRDLNFLQTEKRATGTNKETFKTVEANDKLKTLDTGGVQEDGLVREDDIFHGRNIEDNKFVQPLSNGHYIRSDDLDQKENGRQGLTLYDLDDSPRNGLYLTGISTLDTTHDTKPYHDSLNPIRKSVNPDMNINNNNIHTEKTLKKSFQTPIVTATKQTSEKSETCSMPNSRADTDLINELSKADLEVPKIYSPKLLHEADNIETCLNTIPEVCKIPKCTTIDLSRLFQQHIGYQKRTKVHHNYSSAKQSLKEFREKFSGYTEKSELAPPQQAVNMDDQELLKTAVSQLQELFDRNMSVKVEQDNFRNEKEKVTVKEITKRVDLDEGLRLSERERDTKGSTTKVEWKENQTVLFDSTDSDNKDVVLQKSSAIKSCSLNPDKKAEKSLERNSKEDDKPKQNRPRKHYTNRFAIAHLLQQDNSVFDNKQMTKADENLTDINNHEHITQEEQLLTDDQTQSDGWAIGNYISRSVVTKPKVEVETDQWNSSERPPGMNSYRNGGINNSRTPLLNTMDSFKPQTRESSENRRDNKRNKLFSHQQVSKDNSRNWNSNLADAFSSDSDLDSDSTSESDSSDSSDADQRNYDHRYDAQYNPNKQRFHQDRTNWQYPFPTSANLHEKQFERTVPGNYNRGHFVGQQPGFQYPLHGYQQPHPAFYNPWWNSYGNNFGFNQQEYTQNDMTAAMEKCYDEQRRYIKAMTKFVHVQGREKKGSKKKSKNKR